LGWIDYTIIIGFLLLSIGFGLVMTRKASQNIDNYFLGGRSMPWYLLGISGMAGWFDLTGTMIITSFLFMLGPRGLFIEFRGGAVLILAFLLAYAGKWHRRSGCMTPAEWLSYRFGNDGATNALRVLQAVIGIVGTIGMLAYLVRGTSLFLGMFFPWPPMWLTVILVGITAVYTMCSGFYGVVLTDVVQGIIIMLACLIVAFMAWDMIPDHATLVETARQVTGNTAWTGSLPTWKTTMPRGYEMYESLMMFAGFYLLRNIFGGMGAGAESRYFAARSDRECGLQSMLQGITVAFRWPMMIGFAVMGIFLIAQMLPTAEPAEKAAALIRNFHPQVGEAYWHDLTSAIVNSPSQYAPELVDDLHVTLGAQWREKLPLIGFNGTVNPEQILPAVLMHQIPTGLKGILIMAMLAAMMSTLNTAVNGAGALVVKDIYQNLLRPAAGNRELIMISWISSLGIVALGFWMGVSAGSINDLWGWIVMSFGAGSLAPGLLRLYWWRCNTAGMFCGLLLGGAGAVLQRFLMPEMVEWLQFIVMFALSLGGCVAGSLLTAPTERTRLEHFYRTTRPFGFWGPFRNCLNSAERVKTALEHRNDILTVPFALLWQVTMFLLPMQLVIRSYQAFWCTLPLFLLGLVGMYVFWWKPLKIVDMNYQDECAQPVNPTGGNEC